MKKKYWILCALVLFFIGIVIFCGIPKKHTFTLSNADSLIKSEQIQPLFGTVKVRGDRDTDVVFTDVETGEAFTIGYLTAGASESIKLERGKWYLVKGSGNLTLRPINVRIE